MSKILYLQCNMGAAGDMINAALYELLSEDDKKKYLAIMNRDDEGISVIPESSVKCGISGTHMKVVVNGVEEGYHSHDHHHEDEHSDAYSHDHHHDHHHSEDGHSHTHSHEHSHTHHHASLSDVENVINSYEVPASVKEKALEVYKLIAEAESHAHNKPVSEVHFHEVGMKDAIADVVGACFLVDIIGADKIIVSDINVGYGHVHCAHGILPVPAPATEYILRGAPVYQGHVEGEMCTPTGAAILMAVKSDFGKMPAMQIEKTGYGMGNKDFPEANCVRAFCGFASDEENCSCKINFDVHGISEGDEQIMELSCNLDDMTGEEISYACETLMKAGALDVYTEPIMMKKNRNGIKLICMCNTGDTEKFAQIILQNTTSWGVRYTAYNRFYLKRRVETVSTKLGEVRVKFGEGFGIRKWKPEYEDIAALAIKHSISLKDVENAVAEAVAGLGK